MRCCGLTEYGRREIIAATVIFVCLCVPAAFLAWSVSMWFLAGALVPAAAWLWVLAFFRDPERDGPQEASVFVSPADGVVTDVERIGRQSALGREGVKVGVFMSIFDVHVNRSPADARVEGVEHRGGAFLDARDPASAERNESATIRLTCTRGGAEHPVVVRQIAGLIARRIVTDLRAGQLLRRGERIGMIKFGSRLELLVPAELVGEVRVKAGDRARAGQTVVIAPPPGAGP